METSAQRAPGGQQLLKIGRHAANNVLPLQAMYDSLVLGLSEFHAYKYIRIMPMVIRVSRT